MQHEIVITARKTRKSDVVPANQARSAGRAQQAWRSALCCPRGLSRADQARWRCPCRHSATLPRCRRQERSPATPPQCTTALRPSAARPGAHRHSQLPRRPPHRCRCCRRWRSCMAMGCCRPLLAAGQLHARWAARAAAMGAAVHAPPPARGAQVARRLPRRPSRLLRKAAAPAAAEALQARAETRGVTRASTSSCAAARPPASASLAAAARRPCGPCRPRPWCWRPRRPARTTLLFSPGAGPRALARHRQVVPAR